MLVWLIAALAAVSLAITVNGALSGAGGEAQGSIAQRVRDELGTDFPESALKPPSSWSTRPPRSARKAPGSAPS